MTYMYIYIYIYTYTCAEALGRAAAERKKRFFPKITARLVFEIKRVHFSLLFLPMVIFYHASVRNVKKIILSYIYVELFYSENEIFHIFTYITAAVRQTAKDTEFNYFLSYSTQNCEQFDIEDFSKRLHQTRENLTTKQHTNF